MATAIPDRYTAVGLTHNPFAAPQLDGSHELDVATAFVDRGIPDPPPPRSKTLVQVIGESGYGKTTHLRYWRTALPGPLHYIVRQPYSARWAAPPVPADIDLDTMTVYGDEIDRMPAPLRWRWLRSLASAGATVVIGTHEDLSSLGRRAGFAVITHVLEPVGPAVMASMIDRRLDSVATELGPAVRFDDADIDLVMAESKGVPGEADVVCHKILAQRVL